jgi:hypothetical protein
LEIESLGMRKKKAEERVTQEKPKPKTPFPKKPKDQFLALREWLEQNKERDVMTIIEEDRKLIYGKIREKAVEEGNMEALKVIFTKTFPDIRIERHEQHLDSRQMIELYVRLYPSGEPKEAEDKLSGGASSLPDSGGNI